MKFTAENKAIFFSVCCRLTKMCLLIHCFALVLLFSHSVEGSDISFPKGRILDQLGQDVLMEIFKYTIII